MTTTYNYIFNNLSRIGDDNCGVTARDTQNSNIGSYNTTNYFLSQCGMKKPIDFATKQPGIFYSGGPGNSNSGAGGCNIGSDSSLKIGSVQTHPKCRISLYERPFATVPYLGRGPSRPVIESRLQQGGYSGNKKSCKTVTEKSFNFDQTPLLPSIAASIQNPHNLVEGVAAEGWIRGGLPSRDLTRDTDYIKRKTA